MKLQNPFSIPQWFCLAGIIAIFIASVRMGWNLWTGRGDVDAAIITVGCEAVALGGFAACWHYSHGRDAWTAAGLRFLGFALVLLAGGWIVFTTYEKLNEDAHRRAVASVERSQVYIAAKQDWERARSIANDMSDWERDNPPISDPAACRCPDTIGARQDNYEKEDGRRRTVEAEELAQLQALVPAVTFSPVLIFRSIAAEALKLLGFVAFGIGGVLHQPAPARSAPTHNEQPIQRPLLEGPAESSRTRRRRAPLNLAWNADDSD